MHLVDESLLEILADGFDAAADPHVARARGFLRALERFFDAARHEMENRSTFHLERLSRVVSENEDGHVVHGVLSPPTAPRFVRPLAAHRTEHVTPHDPRSEVLEASTREVVVEPRRSVAVAVDRLEGFRRNEPGVEVLAALAERRLQGLLRPSAVPVERYGETIDA